jgi:hypothetical protein
VKGWGKAPENQAVEFIMGVFGRCILPEMMFRSLATSGKAWIITLRDWEDLVAK